MKTQIDKEVLYSGKVTNGFVMLAVVILLIPAIIAAGFVFLPFELWWLAGVIAGIGLLTMLTLSCGLFVLQPNQARVMIFFGEYQGTFRETGYFWVNPFMTKKKISLRIRNMDIAPIKVNDKVGNPVMIGMILVWKVKDTYRAVFDIDADPAPIVAVDTNEKGSAAAPTNTIAKALNAFVGIQSDAALREVTGRYAYDEENGKQRDKRAARGEAQRASGYGRHRSGRGTSEPSGLRPGDRGGDAAAPAGVGNHLGEREDRRRRGFDGKNGSRPARRGADSDARRRAQGNDGEQSAGGALRRRAGATGAQHRFTLPVIVLKRRIDGQTR